MVRPDDACWSLRCGFATIPALISLRTGMGEEQMYEQMRMAAAANGGAGAAPPTEDKFLSYAEMAFQEDETAAGGEGAEGEVIHERVSPGPDLRCSDEMISEMWSAGRARRDRRARRRRRRSGAHQGAPEVPQAQAR